MYRQVLELLEEWKNRKNRKPLILRGARQVGKTYIVREFAKQYFKQLIEINFEQHSDAGKVFDNLDINQIILNIELYTGKKIVAGETLLFLDEIQVAPQAIRSLRYFYEQKPNLHVIAAGSTLDHILRDLAFSMPVGRVEFVYMYPMNFYEFLLAMGETLLVDFVKNFSFDRKISLPVHQKLLDYVKLYYFIGGMPEAVSVYRETGSIVEVERVHESILQSLEYDFAKYSSGMQSILLSRLLQYIPIVLGQKFKFSNFDRSIKSTVIRQALNLLEYSRVIHIVRHTKLASLPLRAGVSDKQFKVIFYDIGLASHILRLSRSSLQELDLANKGGLTEQFVGQQLLAMGPFTLDKQLFFWIREKKGAEAELDYLIEAHDTVVPVEVKSGKTDKLRSLHVFPTLTVCDSINIDYQKVIVLAGHYTFSLLRS